MTANASAIGAVEYSAESSWAENSESTSVRLRPTGVIDVSGLDQSKMDPGYLKNYPSEDWQHIRGPLGGSFSLEFLLAGLGSTAAGAVPSAPDIWTLLGYFFGVEASSAASGTTATGGTASVPTLTAATGFSAGSLARFGVLGDGRSEGQWAAIGTHSANNANLLTALPVAPNNGDVAYTSRLVYPSETPGTFETITGMRFRLSTANQQYICRGCFPMGAEFSGFEPAALPKVKLTYGVSQWAVDASPATFPVTSAPQNYSASPNVVGSFFSNAVGTVTRATYGIRDFKFNVGLTTQPIMGPGGIHAYQAITGARRLPSVATVAFTLDSEAAGTKAWDDLFSTDENSIVNRHFLYGMSVADGRSLALYVPNAVFIGKRPTQMDMNGLNRVPVEFKCTTGATTTNDLTKSPWRLAAA